MILAEVTQAELAQADLDAELALNAEKSHAEMSNNRLQQMRQQMQEFERVSVQELGRLHDITREAQGWANGLRLFLGRKADAPVHPSSGPAASEAPDANGPSEPKPLTFPTPDPPTEDEPTILSTQRPDELIEPVE